MNHQPRPTWDQTWMAIADTIALRSRCDRAQVGCVVVSPGNHVVATSYNGPPPNWAFSRSEHCSAWCPRAINPAPTDQTYSDCPSSHAEMNAIARSDRSRMDGATVYVTSSICLNCAKALCTTGIARVVHRVLPEHAHRGPFEVEAFIRSCKITVERWNGYQDYFDNEVPYLGGVQG